MLPRLALLVFGVCLAVLFGELLLRVVGYAGAAERRLRRFDARYGAVARDSWIWDFQIDPQRHHAVDLRGQWVVLPKPSDETRILFVGDSATEGAFVALTQSYPRVFKALLDERQPQNHVQAINAGVWGMTNIDEYHLLEDKLLSLQPDIVVIGLFMANDINTNLGHREQVANATSWFDELRTRSALVHVCSLQAMVCNARGRWTAAASRVGYHGARRRPRGFGSSGSRRGRVAHGASCPRTVERAAFVFGRGRGSELRGHGSAAARGAVRVDLDTTRGG